MSPAPESHVAASLIGGGAWRETNAIGLLVAASKDLLIWDPLPGSINVNHFGGVSLPHNGIYSYPGILRDRLKLHSTRFGEWGPRTEYGLSSERKMLKDVFGVSMEFMTDRARVSTMDGDYSFDIRIRSKGQLNYDESQILSAALLLPPESWEIAHRSGIVLLVDPVYESPPIMAGVFLPIDEGLKRLERTDSYLLEKQWDKYGKPVVLYQH